MTRKELMAELERLANSLETSEDREVLAAQALLFAVAASLATRTSIELMSMVTEHHTRPMLARIEAMNAGKVQ